MPGSRSAPTPAIPSSSASSGSGSRHLVGGGSRNDLLCQLTADATGLPVVAGPTEATALGNILVQARAAGLVGDLADMRRLIATTQHLRHYTPRGDSAAWDKAAARLGSAPRNP